MNNAARNPLIASLAKTLPQSPGVYVFRDEKHKPLYVGKAKNLRKRVSSYANPSRAHSSRISRMTSLVRSIEVRNADAETEALLVEATLIKKLKPPFNVLLRDDKSFPHILISTHHPSPRLVKIRDQHLKNAVGPRFGPFASVGAVNQSLNALQRAFLLRTCSDAVFSNRSRPCLLHQINKCSAPCTNEIPPQKYQLLVNDAVNFLSGKSHELQKRLAAQMQLASSQQNFELAATFRDRIKALSAVQSAGSLLPSTFKNADLFAFARQHDALCVTASFFRNSRPQGAIPLHPKIGAHQHDDVVVESFLAQFYARRTPPPLVIVSHPPADHALLQKALSLSAQRSVLVVHPKRGEKALFIQRSLQFAHDELKLKIARDASNLNSLKQLAEIASLHKPPQRIEIYDNSHSQGGLPVGVMVAFGEDGFIPSHKRLFNIKHAPASDDPAMMREVFSRRFHPQRLARSTPNPELILVDGGRSQRDAAAQTLLSLNLHIPVIGVAKGPQRNAGLEQLYLPKQSSPLALPKRHPLLYFIQRLRDEAHRAAIGAHRVRRKQNAAASPLDSVPGVGAARKRALLRRFGSAKAVAEASIHDVASVNGVSLALAHALRRALRSDALSSPSCAYSQISSHGRASSSPSHSSPSSYSRLRTGLG